MKYLFGLVVILGIPALVLFSNPAQKMKPAEEILNNVIENGKSPSVQYFLFNQNEILFSFQNGFADINEKKMVDSTTTYNAFSVTKTFTALAIIQLVKNGLIDLEKPVIHYLSSFPYGKEITVKQLLTHSAGLPNPIPLSWIHLENEHSTFDKTLFFNSIFNGQNKVKSKPNKKFAYSNLGYVILGQLIEKVSGQTYEAYVTEKIIQKLPLKQDDLTFSIPNQNNHAKGYHPRLSFTSPFLGFFIDKSKFMGENEDGWLSFKNFYVNGASYGGLIGKPTAFVKYIQELLKDESILISNDFKALLFQENKNSDGKKTGMCLSWFTGELNGIRYFAHAGGGGGYYCEIRIYPETKMGSVIFFNRTGMSDERFLDKIDSHYLTTF